MSLGCSAGKMIFSSSKSGISCPLVQNAARSNFSICSRRAGVVPAPCWGSPWIAWVSPACRGWVTRRLSEFDFWPAFAVATTTKLAQKQENHPKPMKMVAETEKNWRYYSGSSWSYLIMLKFVPQLCKEGNLFRPLVHRWFSWSQLLTVRWQTIPVSFFKEILQNPIYLTDFL